MNFPTVSVVIVNFNGKNLLGECLTAVLAQDYPADCFEIILVDNNSEDDSVPYVRQNFPNVKLIESEENLGFTGGNQLGLANATGDYIVLLNSDVAVEKNWLKELVAAARPSDVGMVSSRLRYYLPFLELELSSDAFPLSQMNRGIDHSPVGIAIENVICETKHESDLVSYRSGFYGSTGKDVPVRRTTGQAVLFVPLDPRRAKSKVTFVLHAPQSREIDRMNVSIKLDGKNLYRGTLAPYEVRFVELTLETRKLKSNFTWLVQNAGNIVLRNAYSKDRGNISVCRDHQHDQGYEEESGYFLEPCDLLSVCGASCLIKRDVIEHVGFLDGHYFMYYEDVELSLRAWRAGWRIRYAPKSLGYHRHRASTGSGETTFFLEQVERNHLALLLTHFPFMTFVMEWIFFTLRILSCGFWSFAFQFRDLGIAHKYKVRYMGRKAAFRFIRQHFFRLLRSRWEMDKNWPLDYGKLKKNLY